LIWFIKKTGSIEILCHFYRFLLKYKTITKEVVNSKTEKFAEYVSLRILEDLLQDKNTNLLEDTHCIHYGKFKFECKASEIGNKDLKTAVDDVLLKVLGKKEDLN